MRGSLLLATLGRVQCKTAPRDCHLGRTLGPGRGFQPVHAEVAGRSRRHARQPGPMLASDPGPGNAGERMSDKDQGGDKTEKPTPKKLRDARREGNVAKSKDLTSTVLVMGWVAGAWLLMGFMGARI